MKEVGLYGLGRNNHIFDQQVRDGGWQPWVKLREQLGLYGYQLLTYDCLLGKPVFEIHVNAGQPINSEQSFLIAIEPPQVMRKNYSSHVTKKYRMVFTWNDELVNDDHFCKLYYPNPITLAKPVINGFSERSNFSCIISGNKSVSSKDDKELYSERLAVVHWFQEKRPDQFKLYGSGWQFPACKPGLLGKILGKFNKALYRNSNKIFFESYQGKIDEKRNVLLYTKFCFCYENVKGMKGYITEKIFDCFFSGCVPIYLGADNITEYIPEDCFIDRRKFDSMDQLYAHLISIDESGYIKIQENISRFLLSDKAYPFSSEYFAESLTRAILCKI